MACQQCWCLYHIRLFEPGWLTPDGDRKNACQKTTVGNAGAGRWNTVRSNPAPQRNISPHILTSYIPTIQVRDERPTQLPHTLDCSFLLAYLQNMFNFSRKLAEQKAEGVLLFFFCVWILWWQPHTPEDVSVKGCNCVQHCVWRKGNKKPRSFILLTQFRLLPEIRRSL